MDRQPVGHLEVLVKGRRRRDEWLNEAEAAPRQVAVTQRSRGILVTRHDPARYTPELGDKILFGRTHERALLESSSMAVLPGGKRARNAGK